MGPRRDFENPDLLSYLGYPIHEVDSVFSFTIEQTKELGPLEVSCHQSGASRGRGIKPKIGSGNR